MNLIIKAITRYILGLAIVFAMLFIPAGTLDFWNGWLFLAALFLPMGFVLFYLFTRDPALLEKRLNMREREKVQKAYVVLSLVMFVATYTLPGFDFRFSWSQVPLWLVVVATILMLAGYLLFFIVMRQNSYASRTIEIQQGQKVVDTGLYSVVRHPMYSAATLLYVSSTLVLGSFYALIPALLIPVMLSVRLINEEKVLKTNLPGYEEYMEKVRYRLVPYVW
jgi:protein-S-isoprenylcysteine O-methyltransferase Ste14